MTMTNGRTQVQERRLSTVPPKGRSLFLRVIDGRASKRDAIKCMCLECVGWAWSEVTSCTATACPLHRYRPGAS